MTMAKHDGILELMTWEGIEEEGYELGWAAVLKEEADDLKRLFKEKYNSNEEAFFKYWPQGFRWTCCGLAGDILCLRDGVMECGCDYHGTGSMPCQFDFCASGKPLSNKIYNIKMASQTAKGLTLSRGPDPRSYNHSKAKMNEMMRGLLGLDN